MFYSGSVEEADIEALGHCRLTNCVVARALKLLVWLHECWLLSLCYRRDSYSHSFVGAGRFTLSPSPLPCLASTTVLFSSGRVGFWSLLLVFFGSPNTPKASHRRGSQMPSESRSQVASKLRPGGSDALQAEISAGQVEAGGRSAVRGVAKFSFNKRSTTTAGITKSNKMKTTRKINEKSTYKKGTNRTYPCCQDVAAGREQLNGNIDSPEARHLPRHNAKLQVNVFQVSPPTGASSDEQIREKLGHAVIWTLSCRCGQNPRSLSQGPSCGDVERHTCF